MTVPRRNSTQYYYFSINASYIECETLYSPHHSDVVMTAENGLKIQVPAVRLRPFVTPEGLSGRFRMTVDQNNKILAFERLR
ncbi:DUF2835 family protein [Alteromonas sp. 345S023]|uniref:DUF2835 family protein n=1 Tax=Alteromonas profundi TaxID=2696062 RepID=A0A7X5RLB8_9ALTE|nr:DUF2835 family protein [Alteromonas profundi]NDV91275.1 DUF2835 family protein [Alteromonas profundi]